MNRADLLHLAEAAISEEEGTLSGDLAAAIDAVEPVIRADERARIAHWLRRQAVVREDPAAWPGVKFIADLIEKGEF